MQVQGAARTTLTSLVEEHLSGLIRDAVSVQRHAKRARWHGESDRSNNNGTHPAEIYHHHRDDRSAVLRRRLHAADINLALQLRGSEKIYGTPVVVPDSDDPHRKVALDDFLRQEAEIFPAAPAEVGLRMHWLAVDGMQPAIPQNPSASVMAAAEMGDTGDGGATATTNPEDRTSTNGVGDDATEAGFRVKQLQASLLSEELQLYFTRVCTAMERKISTAAPRRQQDSILLSVARDPGLQELVPFLVRYCQQELYRQIKIGNAEQCRTLVRLASSLLYNPHLHLELHLHELLPVLMTCVVAAKLTSSTVGGTNNTNKNNNPNAHWALRREAAAALVRACDLFGEEYATLKARVLRALCDATTPDKSLPTRYGGWVAISLFGPKAVDAFLLPVAAAYWREWEETLLEENNKDDDAAAVASDASSSAKAAYHYEIRMCQQAALAALGIFLQQVSDAAKAERVDWFDLEETFADRLVVLAGDEKKDDYAMCFI